MMRALVCGGRYYSNFQVLAQRLDALQLMRGKFSVIIHGKGKGADMLADQYARIRGIPVKPYPADWDRFGRSAGPHRNQQMLDRGRPDIVIAFPGGVGTRDMVNRATRAGVPVEEVG